MNDKTQPDQTAGNTNPPLATLLANLAPRRWAGNYIFYSLASLDGINPADHVAIVRESEGWTLISDQGVASQQRRVKSQTCFTAITLDVRSTLCDVGLSAAVSRVLAEAGIACNIVAGFYHDHIFVPAAQADRALALLDELQRAYCSAL